MYEEKAKIATHFAEDEIISSMLAGRLLHMPRQRVRTERAH